MGICYSKDERKTRKVEINIQDKSNKKNEETDKKEVKNPNGNESKSEITNENSKPIKTSEKNITNKEKCNLKDMNNNANAEIKKLEEKNNDEKTDYQNSTEKLKEESEKKSGNELTECNNNQKEFDKISNSTKEETKIDDKFLNNSMLLYYSDPINNPPLEIITGELLINNFIEKCYVLEEFDLYERNFEYQAVGLPKRVYGEVNEISFIKERIIKIIEFKIDNKNMNYNYDDKNSKLKFETIKLKDSDIKKVYLKYQLSKKLNEGQKKQRKIYREDEYGISKNLKGRNALFYLIIKNDMEVISFDDEIFIKEEENVYKIEGLIPNEGKKTRVILSKKSAKYHFCYNKIIKTKDGKKIKDTELKLHFYFEEGGNKKNKVEINRTTNPPDKILNIDKKSRQYEIKFENINENSAEVKIEGELINHCKGEWSCDLTADQIENEIPNDYKENKEDLKKIANDIIKEYDENHKNDSVEITNVAKIGKWIKKNIKYDENYKEESQNQALEIYKNKIGVCKQFTILYNALLYSLGYKCVYISGFAFKDNDCFQSTDAHSWSLVRINGKWLPFDSTWGIFSGKLPVCHIFQDYFLKPNCTKSKDNLDQQKDKVFGEFIE